jgi:hypothetical protein
MQQHFRIWLFRLVWFRDPRDGGEIFASFFRLLRYAVADSKQAPQDQAPRKRRLFGQNQHVERISIPAPVDGRKPKSNGNVKPVGIILSN